MALGRLLGLHRVYPAPQLSQTVFLRLRYHFRSQDLSTVHTHVRCQQAHTDAAAVHTAVEHTAIEHTVIKHTAAGRAAVGHTAVEHAVIEDAVIEDAVIEHTVIDGPHCQAAAGWCYHAVKQPQAGVCTAAHRALPLRAASRLPIVAAAASRCPASALAASAIAGCRSTTAS